MNSVTPGLRTGLKLDDLAQTLRKDIVSGRLSNGSLLPGEHQLAARYAVSRSTVRRALERLSDDHLIETLVGVGSYVTFDGVELSDPARWGRPLAGSDVVLEPTILRLERITDPELAATVGAVEMDFIAVDRIRHVHGDRPVSLERSRVPALGRLAQVPELGLVEGSLSATMSEAGLVPVAGEQWVAAAPLNEQDAAVLDRRPGDVFLHSVRLSRGADGAFVEKVVSWLDPARFRMHVTFGQAR